MSYRVRLAAGDLAWEGLVDVPPFPLPRPRMLCVLLPGLGGRGKRQKKFQVEEAGDTQESGAVTGATGRMVSVIYINVQNRVLKKSPLLARIPL